LNNKVSTFTIILEVNKVYYFSFLIKF